MSCVFCFAQSSAAQKPIVQTQTSKTYKKYPKRLHKEAEYQTKWCTAQCGIMEYKNDDKTRVDCLTSSHAIEFDFADKLYESIGQALFYSLKTGKKPGVVLIMEHPEKEQKYLKRLLLVAKAYGITVWTMYPTDLQ